jgi:3-hydroxyacyl-[acyl-carrier-protein] dehydratase
VKVDLSIASDHPAYEGHFPGHPLLPGVVLLAEAMGTLDAAQWSIDKAKFLLPVEPGTALTLTHEALASGARRIEVASSRGVVATAVISPP